MKVLLIAEVLVSLDGRIVSLISLGELLVTIPVWDDKSESEQENDHDLNCQ